MSRGKLVGTATALALALGLLLAWAPAAGRRAHARENQARLAVASRQVHVSPAELATLMHSRQVPLAIFDLRDESAYNLFHIVDARRSNGGDLVRRVRALPERTVKVLIATGEDAETRAFLALAAAGARQVYVLDGGIRAWLDLFARAGGGLGLLANAVGGRHPASNPDIEAIALPAFQPRVKLQGAGPKKSAGCGG